ncbi:MAG TPA: PQQ-binding-like beta-propeller repeat protein [Bryobacteraceae bacterium]|nr:PQQ-binding-like beta-propeller repeat protein [Bryobacteraceae bacterium]
MPRAIFFSALAAVALPAVMVAGDWADWRGPRRDGTSPEKNLPVKWSPAGENVAWKAPYGGRSAPIVMGSRVFVFNPVGARDTLQERIMCLDTNTGKVLWEHRQNVFMSDVPPHRVAWSSPAGDPATGNVYIFGVGGTLAAFSNDGKPLWERSLAEEMGLVTTHGGRTVSPVVEGDLVIVSGITSGWGNQARAAHRFMAFDKRTGETVWVSAPGGRPFDTTYSPPIVADVNGTRLFIAGGSDGTVHAIRANTGEPVWKYVVSKRGLNTGVVLNGTTAFVSHSEENLDSSEMGLLAAIDATAKGDIGKQQIKWAKLGFQGGFSSPVIDGDRILQVDNGANLYAFDLVTGRQLWQLNTGTIQKASPVLADGKLYTGSENGRFYILRPGQEKADVLDEDDMPLAPDGKPEAIIGSPAVANGHIFLVTTENIYCIGPKTAAAPARATAPSREPPSTAPVAHVQVVPTELILKPGDKVRFRARLFDANARFIREDKAAWTLENLKGALAEDGQYTAAPDAAAQAGNVKATVNGITGVARVRVIPPLPWSENFDSLPVKAAPAHWINATGKFEVRQEENNRTLAKLADNPFTKRARVFMGPADWSNYTVEADVRAVEKRRQMGDAGVVAQRYSLILFGNHQRMELQSWQPETARTAEKPFPWKADTWYRIKLRVEPTADGKVRALGKAWPVSDAEPPAWQIERIDANPNRQGSPGIYADAINELFFDNLKVTANR